MPRVVTFGEIMGRLSPPGFGRLRQAMPGQLDVSFAGAEANVAVSLALFGAEAAFVTALPENPIAEACLATLRAVGVDTRYVRLCDFGRVGLYFVEAGANQRPSRIVYDRAHATVSLAPPDTYDWPAILSGADWFHTTGITPALSEAAAQATIAAVRQAKQGGITVSCDLNFRSKLWRWEEGTPSRTLAGRVMHEVLPHVDVLIANEEDCVDVLGIHAGESDVTAGRLDHERYPDVAREVVGQFPNITRVATTLRQSFSASHNNWGAMLYDAASGQPHFAPRVDGRYSPYEIRNIVDRVGGGDAFAAGLIFALTCPDFASLDDALRFAVAASCLAHSIPGDFNYTSREEVEALMGGSRSGRVVR
jgi:2-dehydro-3-deoxygluconokinase